MNPKAFARFLYANVPGIAPARFLLKDILAPYISKGEYHGVSQLSVGNGLIIDVGANRGHSVAAFRRLAPHSRIMAFEPNPILSHRLRTKFQHDPAVGIFDCALSASPGNTIFYLPTYGMWECDGMSAMSRDDATEWLKDPNRMFWFDESKLDVKEHLVEIHTLDSFAVAPALIKLHTQGAELEILRGARETIREHKPAIMCAFPWPALIDELNDWNYRAYNFKGGKFQPGIAARDATFTWFLPDNLALLINHSP